MAGVEKVPMYHKTCNNIAFYSIGRFKHGDEMRSSRFILLDGGCPKPLTPMVCGSCGKNCHSRTLEYRDNVAGK